MMLKDIKELVPVDWLQAVQTFSARKDLAEKLYETLLVQIESEGRTPNNWECIAISRAIGFMRFENYVSGISELIFCFLMQKTKVSPTA